MDEITAAVVDAGDDFLSGEVYVNGLRITDAETFIEMEGNKFMSMLRSYIYEAQMNEAEEDSETD